MCEDHKRERTEAATQKRWEIVPSLPHDNKRLKQRQRNKASSSVEQAFTIRDGGGRVVRRHLIIPLDTKLLRRGDSELGAVRHTTMENANTFHRK